MKDLIPILILIVISVIAPVSHGLCQNLEPIGYCDMPDSPWAVKIAGNYAYLACDSSGVVIVDVGDPTNPEIASSLDTPGAAYDLDVVGDFLYVADYSSFQIIDISDPYSPETIGIYSSASIFKVHAVGNVAYLGRAYNSPNLLLLDITDPTNPDSLSGLSLSGGAFDVFCAGDYVSVLSNVTEPYSNFLRLVNIADSQYPYLESSVQIPGFWRIPEDVKVSGGYAYIADRIYGLQIVDISDPSNPALVRDFSTYGSTIAVAIQGDYIFLTDSYGYVYMIDNHDPEAPVLLDIAVMHFDGISIAANSGYVFLINDSNMMVIYSYGATGLETSNPVPSELSLSQNYPNPFNPQTEISYDLPSDTHVNLTIFNSLGQKISVLVDSHQKAGQRSVIWSGEDDFGNEAASGIYYYVLTAGEFSQTQRMALIR